MNKVDSGQTSKLPKFISPAESVFYRPELDILRLSAFLMVFFHHVLPLNEGFYLHHWNNPLFSKIMVGLGNALGFGLPLFFFLSAYLIAKLMLMEEIQFGNVNVKAFLIRRILRIWPLYFMALLAGWIYAELLSMPEQREYLIYSAFFLGNVYFQHHDWLANPVTPLWSISVEEQFYIVFPIFFVTAGGARIKYVGAVFIVMSAAALAWQGMHGARADTSVWTNPLSHLIFFGTGIVCASVQFLPTASLNLFQRIIIWSSSIFLFILASTLTDAISVGPAQSGLSLSLGYGFVALACTGLFWGLSDLNIRFPKPILYLGKVSFGLYVFHLFNIMAFDELSQAMNLSPSWALVVRPLAIIPTILMAMASYRWIESPFLRLRHKFARIQNRAV